MSIQSTAYETLYTHMKNKFTVVQNKNEYTLGDYMAMRAKAIETPVLPAGKESASRSLLSYVAEKLSVKTPPAKEHTIRRFPMRTCAAAVFCAVIFSSFLLSFGSITQQKNAEGGNILSSETSGEETEKETTSLAK